MKLSTNPKKQHQEQGTNGLGDELLIILDYLIQLEPLDSQDTQTQPILQLRHPNKPLEYFRVLAVARYKTSLQFHINCCPGKPCFPSSAPAGCTSARCCYLVAFNIRPILTHRDALIAGRPLPASAQPPRKN